MTYHQICDSCETVAHCTKHGCIPLQPANTDWQAIAADQALTIALLKSEQQSTQQKPLTLHQIVKLTQGLDLNSVSWVDLVRAVEAAHGIKP